MKPDRMQTLRFSAVIDAPRETVWETMLDQDAYSTWTAAFAPDCAYQGEWKDGADIKFLGQGMGGTKARIFRFRPGETVALRHVAVITEDGAEDTESDVAKTWIGATETYAFTDADGKTKLDIEIVVRPEWVGMNEEGWPKALEILKGLAERRTGPGRGV